MTVYVFPGQGSQIRGMGNELFREFPEYIAKANTILGYSIQTVCLEDPQQQLNQTQFTQPALDIITALSYLKKIQQANNKPNYVLGHSLGEYTALFAAGVFDFETGLQLVKKRGELMGQASGGAMAAVVGLKTEEVRAVLIKNDLTDLTIANYNSYTQIVLSGLKEDVRKAQDACIQAGAIMVVPLKVSGAFHSPYMHYAQEQFEIFLREFQFTSHKIPIIANCTARPYQGQVGEFKKNLSQQITHPVRWVESIDYLLSEGETNFEEVGPGNVLTGLIQRIKNKR